MIINWTKCSEQMPPDGMEIILMPIGCAILYQVNHINKYLQKVIDRFPMQWIEYTEEAWNELNSNSPELDGIKTGSEISSK